MSLPFNEIIQGDCLEVMRGWPSECIDLTVTSPPYDNLRTYNGFSFDFEGIAQELYRITKPGGVVVWVVGDATVEGSETGVSFKQALYFKETGFNLHDTMIYLKSGFAYPSNNRYHQVFEYMFVFTKDKPKTFNPIMDHENITKRRGGGKARDINGKMVDGGSGGLKLNKHGKRWNAWYYSVGGNKTTKDKIAYQHPAMFPEQLAHDHIISWSNKGDTVLDPMCGSGTTCKMAMANNREYIGIDISEEYCEISRKRIAEHQQQLTFEAIT